MGIRITTDDYGIKVWRSDRYEYPQYAVAISSKTESGESVTEYRQLQFRRGIELANGEEIIIHDCFPTLRVWQDKQTGETRHKEVWVVLDFSYKTQHQAPDPQPARQQNQQPVQMQITSQMTDLPDSFDAVEDDIPF